MPAQDPLSARGYRLLETLLLERGQVFLATAHLRRLADSARCCGFVFDEGALRRRLADCAAAHPVGRHRLRLLLDRHGAVELRAQPLADGHGAPWRVALASHPVDAADPWLRHKTTRRELYDRHRAEWPGCDDVLLYNRSGLLTESCIANLVLQIDGDLLTPALHCGLLPGTFRGELLARGEIREAELPLAELRRAERLWLINSLRRWVPVAGWPCD